MYCSRGIQEKGQQDTEKAPEQRRRDEDGPVLDTDPAAGPLNANHALAIRASFLLRSLLAVVVLVILFGDGAWDIRSHSCGQGV